MLPHRRLSTNLKLSGLTTDATSVAENIHVKSDTQSPMTPYAIAPRALTFAWHCPGLMSPSQVIIYGALPSSPFYSGEKWFQRDLPTWQLVSSGQSQDSRHPCGFRLDAVFESHTASLYLRMTVLQGQNHLVG